MNKSKKPFTQNKSKYMISRRFQGEYKKYDRLREVEERADDLNTTLNSNNPNQKN
jgi:hypothetical protein